MLLLVAVLPLMGARAAEQPLGPFAIQSGEARSTAYLLRREGDTVWLRRPSAAGGTFDAGVPARDIGRIDMPRPPVLDVWERTHKPAEIRSARAVLERLEKALWPYRDLPGVHADETVYAQARLDMREERWADALERLNTLTSAQPPSAFAHDARREAGFCRIRLGQYEAGLRDLEAAPPPEDDPSAVGAYHLARGEALRRLGRPSEAAEACLYPVVFIPFFDHYEPRGLEAVLPCYLAMNDREACERTLSVLRADYPDHPATRRAEEWAEAFLESTERSKGETE